MATLYDKKLSAPQAADIAKTGSVAQTLSLTYGERQRNRLAVMLPSGQAAAIVLPRGQFLQVGDVLTSADGELLSIEAQPETLLCARAQSRLDQIRLVYHLANRHVRAMLSEDAVYIEPDPVLADLMVQLGATVRTVSVAFEPEGGAYAGGHPHHHHDHHQHGSTDDGASIDTDAAMGKVGEMLSMAAHRRNDQDKRRGQTS